MERSMSETVIPMVSTAFTIVLSVCCSDQAGEGHGLTAIEDKRTSTKERGIKRNDRKDSLDIADTRVVISISLSFLISYMQMHCFLQDTQKSFHASTSSA
jgi:hypothetical protein